MFKLGIVVDVVPITVLDKGWEYFEVPCAIHGGAELSEKEWQDIKRGYEEDGRPTPVTSHMLGLGNTWQGGSGVYYDRDLIAFCLERSISRMAQLGVKTIGSWGGHYRCQTGFDRVKAMDQALSTVNMAADIAGRYGMQIALEPQAESDTLFPRYLEGIEFAKKTGRSNVKVMADLNYFLELDQPLEDILKYPEYCLNVHIQGDGGAQPNVGSREQTLLHLFNVLKDAGYEHGVSSACPWVSTNGSAEIDFKLETDITLKYLQELRAKIYK